MGIAVASMEIAHHKAERPVALERVSQPVTTPAPKISESTPPTEIPAAETKPEVQPAGVPVKANPQKTSAQTAPPAQAGQQNQPIRDPDARVALSFVGADPYAEIYWIGAINDQNLSARERQDLIEDLNEDGLSDPRHPGVEDVPLIVSRIQLIEELAPYAMDQVNADAFAEAYKDLVNMLNGRPVQ
jgi:hypothetical protein